MPIQTPICDFGQKAIPFELKSTDNKILSLNDIKGENGTLIMFICNHCPYVKAITKELVEDCSELKKIGINSVAICSNDFVNYPDDSFDNMIKVFQMKIISIFLTYMMRLKKLLKHMMLYALQISLATIKNLELQYRGRLRELKKFIPVKEGRK